MTATPRRSPAAQRAGAGIVAAVVLLALNLRSVLAGLPPLVDDIRADLGLSAAAAGVLTTLPVLLLFVFARRLFTSAVLGGAVKG